VLEENYVSRAEPDVDIKSSSIEKPTKELIKKTR